MECRFCRCEVTEVSFVQARRWSLCLKAGRIQTFHPTTRAWAPNSLATARSLSAFLGLKSSWRFLTPKVSFMILIEWLYDYDRCSILIFCNNLMSEEVQQILWDLCKLSGSYQQRSKHWTGSTPKPTRSFEFCDFHSSKCQAEGHWARILKYTSSPVLFDDAEPGDTLQGMLGGQSEVNISLRSRREDHLLGRKHSACIWYEERTTSLMRIGIQYTVYIHYTYTL